ncbi:hypothetical protein TNCV_184151 [Trichonephila clavipes]|nr:hypothetical protein TNCV_184151 [Trichonephila clavipes]
MLALTYLLLIVSPRQQNCIALHVLVSVQICKTITDPFNSEVCFIICELVENNGENVRSDEIVRNCVRYFSDEITNHEVGCLKLPMMVWLRKAFTRRIKRLDINENRLFTKLKIRKCINASFELTFKPASKDRYEKRRQSNTVEFELVDCQKCKFARALIWLVVNNV